MLINFSIIKKLALSLILLSMISTLYAKNNIWNKEHEIDSWTAAALSKAGGVTSEIRNVYAKAYKKWDDELNRLYKILLSKLDNPAKQDLRVAQRQWIKYRDSEFKYIENVIQKNNGTISLVMSDERMVRLVRDRVLVLRAYIYIIDNPP